MKFDTKKAYNIVDLRAAARKVLPRGLFEFVDRGTEDEVALRSNREAFEKISFCPRVLVDVSDRKLDTKILGVNTPMPLIIAPTGAAGLLWHDGEIAVARAATNAGIPFSLSTASIIGMERVAAEAGGRLWFQLYMWSDRHLSHQLVDRAKAAGYESLIVTVDNAAPPNREYNRRNGFSLPLRITATNIMDVAMHPGWFINVFARYLLNNGIPTLENYPDSLRIKLNAPCGELPRCDSLKWDDLKELRKRWTGPLIVKGVLHPDDASMAVDCGADAVVVSNHGGRNLDSSIPPIYALPAVVDRVGNRCEVFVDSGFTRGSDVIKALALGARAVLVGRAPLWGVSCAGQDGVARALEILRDEMMRVLGLTGCLSTQNLDATLLRRVANLSPYEHDSHKGTR